ncbi:Reverse transcriptase [Theobroma cacao]|nr:Reverse transcriptase [Theobroma cacao]
MADYTCLNVERNEGLLYYKAKEVDLLSRGDGVRATLQYKPLSIRIIMLINEVKRARGRGVGIATKDRASRLGSRMAPVKLKELKDQLEDLLDYGYIVSKNGLQVYSKKIEAVEKWLRLTSMMKIYSFLGLASYDHKFVMEFSRITALMTKLTQKGVKFIWIDACEESFEKLKTCLTITSLKRHEQNYPTHDLEMATIVFALKILRHYLYGETYEIYMKQKGFKFIFKQGDLTLKQCQWMELFKDYGCIILYDLDKDNIVANALCYKFMGSLAHISINRRSLVQDMHDLGEMRVQFEVDDIEAFLAKSRVKKQKLLGSGMVQETTDKIQMIRQKMLVAQSCQKSYVDHRRKDLEFEYEKVHKIPKQQRFNVENSGWRSKGTMEIQDRSTRDIPDHGCFRERKRKLYNSLENYWKEFQNFKAIKVPTKLYRLIWTIREVRVDYRPNNILLSASRSVHKPMMTPLSASGSAHKLMMTHHVLVGSAHELMTMGECA